MTSARYTMLVVIVASFVVMNVAQRTRLVQLGYCVELLDAERDTLAESNRLLHCDITSLSSPDRVAGEVERLNIALFDPVALSKASAREEPGVRRQGGGNTSR